MTEQDISQEHAEAHEILVKLLSDPRHCTSEDVHRLLHLIVEMARGPLPLPTLQEPTRRDLLSLWGEIVRVAQGTSSKGYFRCYELPGSPVVSFEKFEG